MMRGRDPSFSTGALKTQGAQAGDPRSAARSRAALWRLVMREGTMPLRGRVADEAVVGRVPAPLFETRSERLAFDMSCERASPSDVAVGTDPPRAPAEPGSALDHEAVRDQVCGSPCRRSSIPPCATCATGEASFAACARAVDRGAPGRRGRRAAARLVDGWRCSRHGAVRHGRRSGRSNCWKPTCARGRVRAETSGRGPPWAPCSPALLYDTRHPRRACGSRRRRSRVMVTNSRGALVGVMKPKPVVANHSRYGAI